MSVKKLEGRRKAFAEKMAEGHTATEAYLLAGYRAAKRETAHRAASRLYAKPEIRAYIQELRRTGDELAREETTLTIAKKLTFLARLVLTSSATLREDDPLIQSYRLLKDGTTSIRMPCKLKALKMHSELAGHFLPKPAEQAPPVDPFLELLSQIRAGLYEPGDTKAPSPKNEHILPSTAGRAITSGAADLSRNSQTSTAPIPRANANQSPNQNPKPLPTTTTGLESHAGGTDDWHTSQSEPTESHSPLATKPTIQPNSPAPPSICKLKTEQLNRAQRDSLSAPTTAPASREAAQQSNTSSLTPTQLRKAIIAQIQQSSSLNLLNHNPPSLPVSPEKPPIVLRP